MTRQEARTVVVPLEIEEPTGVSRERWPVRRGIPFHQGQLSSPDNIRLLDPSGEEVSCHIKELARWADGSVKWVLLQFQVDLSPQEKVTYSLE